MSLFSFFCDLFANRFLLVEKVSVGLQRKILLQVNKLWNKRNCTGDKLPSDGSFSRENGRVAIMTSLPRFPFTNIAGGSKKIA